MKKLSTLAALMLVILAACLIATPHNASAQSQSSQIDLWAIISLRDHETDMPISNVSLAAYLWSSWGYNTAYESTNETGFIQVYLGRVQRITRPSTPRLYQMDLYSNYTITKICDRFIEDVPFQSEYRLNRVGYFGDRRYNYVNVRLKSMGNQTFIEIDLLALKGKLVAVSDRDPFTGARRMLGVKPAIKAQTTEFPPSQYESHYFFPLNQPVDITTTGYSPVTVTVNESTSIINWMYHAANTYADERLSSVNKEMNWFRSLGFPLLQEAEDIRAIRSLMDRAIDFLEDKDYGNAIGGAKAAMERLDSLENGLFTLKTFSALTSIGLYLFAYGLAYLLPYFIFEEKIRGRIRLAGKLLVFSSLLLLFSLTQPCMKLTYALLIESMLHVPTWSLDLPATLWGCLFLGSFLYLLFMVISMRETPITDLALNLGVRGLKRRRFRTILTLITLTIIVASAVSLINISSGQVIRVSESWEGTDTPGVMVQADIVERPLGEYDINWTIGQAWCKDLGYMEEIQPRDPNNPGLLSRDGVVIIGEVRLRAQIVGIDPDFMERYHHLREFIRGGYFTIGEAAVILPTTYEGVVIGDDVTLAVEEWLETAMDPITRIIGTFKVGGKFDHESIAELKAMDNNPLFDKTHMLVLVPIKAITVPYMVISRATILTERDYDPMDVAKELVFALGVTAIANKDGVAVRIEWLYELQATGAASYLFPLTIAGLMVYTTMASIYEERREEFISLATLGLDPKSVFRIFMAETLILGLLATFLGFFGSYMMIPLLSQVLTFLRAHGIPTPDVPITYVNWSLSAIIVALLTGTVMTLLGGYIPAVRAQGLGLLGRTKKRQIGEEIITEDETTSFPLPLRMLARDGELLYQYTLESLAKSSLVDHHSIGGEVRRDGSFVATFEAWGPGSSISVPCKVRGVREGESLISTVEFPTSRKSYGKMWDILRGLEENMIAFPSWIETRRKIMISRGAPKKKRTPEDILADVREMVEQIKDGNSKLRELEALRRAKLSEEVYVEFKQKYTQKVEELHKRLGSVAIGLEPYQEQIHQEIKELDLKVERITTAYTLAEISREEYEEKCGPLQGKLATLTDKAKELGEIFEFLKMPSRAI